MERPRNPYRRGDVMAMEAGWARVRPPRTLGLRDLEIVVEQHLEEQREALEEAHHIAMQDAQAGAWERGMEAGVDWYAERCTMEARSILEHLSRQYKWLRRTKAGAAFEALLEERLNKIVERRPW